MTLPAAPMPKPPANVAPYVEVLGADLAVIFFLSFGGAVLYLADDPKGRSKLEALVGNDLARAMAEQAHRMQRRVPLAKPWTAPMLAWQGHATAEIARRLHVTDVTVRGYLRKFGPQADGKTRPWTT